MQKPLLNFRPRPEIAELIKTMAAADRRPISQFLSILIEDALAKKTASPEQRSAA
jgi:hypothetical protein